MNRRTRKRSKQKGGKLVGQGSYGCGFFPGFRCATEKQRKNQFSKLMLTDDAIKEFNSVKDIRKIDPQMKYSAYPNTICNLHAEDFDIANEEGLFECDMFEKDLTIEQKKEMYDRIVKTNQLKLLQAPFAGEELHKIKLQIVHSNLNKKEQIMHLLKEMTSIFDGLEYYHSNDLVHLDIKADNVVCNDSCKYIDFGVSSSINTILKKRSFIYNKLHDWAKKRYLYKYRSFDLLFIFDDLWIKLQENSNDEKGFFETEVNNFYKILAQKKEVPMEVYNGLYIEEDGKYLIKLINGYSIIIDVINRFIQENKSSGLSKSLKKFILLQSDVYSLGLMMVAQIRDIFQVQMYYGNLYRFGDEITQKKRVTNTIIDYKIVIDLFNLCKKMMHLDPFQRLTAAEAATQYKSIIQRLD